MRARNAWAVAGWTIALWAVATSAWAQNPELGLTGEVEAEASTEEEASAEGSWTPAAAPSPASDFDDDEEPAETESAPAGGSDHDAVVGRLGVGFFGVMEIPVMICSDAPGACAVPVLGGASAPTIGARYWLDAGVGVELAFGFNLSSPESQTDTTVPGGSTMRLVRTEEPSVLALGVHGGLPLVFAHSGHFVFEFVPQLNFGLATGEHDVVTGAAQTTWDVSGLLLELAGKIGAEIHFGFIDVPQLSLQATVGLGVRIESRSAENTNAAGSTTTHEQSLTRISTGVDGAPWEIFTGALTAIYYL